MKKGLILLFSFLLICSVIRSQNVQFPPAIISAGGSMAPQGDIRITRWRTAEIHVLTLTKSSTSDEFISVPEEGADWSGRVFPNPFISRVKVGFRLNNPTAFSFELWDMAGKKILTTKKQLFDNGQEAELDLSNCEAGLYLLRIIAPDQGKYKVYKLSKD